MAAEMKVTDEAVGAAFNAWCDVADVDEWRVRNSQEALRAALEAGLAAMLEPVNTQQFMHPTWNKPMYVFRDSPAKEPK